MELRDRAVRVEVAPAQPAALLRQEELPCLPWRRRGGAGGWRAGGGDLTGRRGGWLVGLRRGMTSGETRDLQISFSTSWEGWRAIFVVVRVRWVCWVVRTG